jgi:hypothetical protein
MTAKAPTANANSQPIQEIPPVPALPPLVAAAPANTAPASKEGYVSTGVIVVENEIQPASHETLSKPPAQEPKGAQPYVSTGLILIDEIQPIVDPKLKRSLLQLQSRLQQRIATVCGKPVKDVEVTARSERDLLVRVQARTNQEGEAICSKVFQLPDLEPYRVSLEIPVKP